MAKLPKLKLPDLQLGPLALPSGTAAQRAAPEQLLAPEEEQGLLSQILRTGLGGVQYLGESLDKPASAVRGLLATGLDPAQLLHAIPFSETLGLDTEKKYTGRELLHAYGLASRNKPGFRGDVAGDLAGFAAEVGLDPLWLLAGLPLVKGAATGGKAALKAISAAKTVGESQKAFRAAEKAIQAGETVLSRTVPKTTAAMAKQIRAGKRGIVGLRLPFTQEPIAVFGAGSELGAKAIEWLSYGNTSPFMWMRGLFSHSADAKGVKEFFLGRGAFQRSKDLAFAEKQLMDDAILEFSGVLDREAKSLSEHLGRIAEHHRGTSDVTGFNEFVRTLGELPSGLPRGEHLANLFRESAKISQDAPLEQIVREIDGVADRLHTYVDSVLEIQNRGYNRVLGLGGHGTLLDDLYVQHSARSRSLLSRLRKGKRFEQRPNFEPARRRKDWTRNVPGGSKTINAASRDPLLAGTAHATKAEKLEIKKAAHAALRRLNVPHGANEGIVELQTRYVYHQYIERQLNDAWDRMILSPDGAALDDLGNVRVYPDAHPLKGMPITRENEIAYWTQEQFRAEAQLPSGLADQKARRIPSRSERMVNVLRGLDPRVRERGIFDQPFLTDAMEYTKAIHEWESALRTGHHLLEQPGVVRKAVEGDTWSRLRDVWESVVIRQPGKGRPRRALTDEGLRTFARNNAESLGITADQLADPKALDAAIDSLRVAPKARPLLDGIMQTLRPEVQTEVGKLIDQVNSLWKGWLFTPWPAAHSRNLVSGFYQSYSDGHINPLELAAGYKAAYRFLKGKGNLESLELLKREGMLGRTGFLSEVAGAEAAGRVGVPGGGLAWALSPYSPRNIVRKGWTTVKGRRVFPKALDPFALRGFRKQTPEMAALGQEVVRNAPMEAGERAYALVEFLNRAGYAEALLKKGYSPSEIKHLVTRSQFNYASLSKFEQRYLSRAVLFYGWPRNNVPFTLSKMLDRPGGITTQTLRAMNSTLGQGEAAPGEDIEYTPSFLRETLALRFGGPPQEAQFIRASGLPVEELNKVVVGDPRRTAEKLASYLHPGLVAGPEMALDRQFWTGRKLSDLEPITGSPLVDRALAISPASRVVTEARGVFDQRKAWWQRLLNATTGIKTSTYDTEYWRVRDLERAILRQMQRDPIIREGLHYYVPKAERPTPGGAEAAKVLSQHRKLRARLAELRRKKDLQSQGAESR